MIDVDLNQAARVVQRQRGQGPDALPFERDQVVDFVRRWSEETEISVGRFIHWLGVKNASEQGEISLLVLFCVPNMFDSLGVEVPCPTWWR